MNYPVYDNDGNLHDPGDAELYGSRHPDWFCGAFQPPQTALMAYRCTRPARHDGWHHAVVQGEKVAEWPVQPGPGGP